MVKAQIRDWLFRGVAIDHRLDELEQEGLAVRALDDPGALQRVVPLHEFRPETREGAIKALEAYLILFLFENSVRDLIRERMTENHGPDWWQSAASDAIKKSATLRQEKEGANRWHAQRGAHPIHYIDFGDLGRLIIGNWSDFQDLIPDQSWLSTRLNELEQTRNIVAHSNVLEQRELDRLRLYIEDWKRQTGG